MYLQLKNLETQRNDFVQIKHFTIVDQNPNVLFVTPVDKFREKTTTYHIRNVKLLAKCTVEHFDTPLMIAFLPVDSALEFWPMYLPEGKYDYTNDGFMIDYKSYLDTCNLTQEKKLNVAEYIDFIKMNGSYDSYVHKDSSGKWTNDNGNIFV